MQISGSDLYSEYGYLKYKQPANVIPNVAEDKNLNRAKDVSSSKDSEEEGLTPQLKEAIARYKRANPDVDSSTIANAIKKQDQDIERSEVERVLNEKGLNEERAGKITPEDNQEKGDILKEKGITKEEPVTLQQREDKIAPEDNPNRKKSNLTPEIEQQIVKTKRANPEVTPEEVKIIVSNGKNEDISVEDVKKVLQKNDLSDEDKKSEKEKTLNKAAGALTEEEKQQVAKLRQRDTEVKNHEAAHIAAGGQYVRGGAHYAYQEGPDGRRYAVGGDVSISTGPEKTPEESIRKAQIVRNAALAPSDPSSADTQIAAAASKMEMSARQELTQQKTEETRETKGESKKEKAEIPAKTKETTAGFEGKKIEKEEREVSLELEREIVNKKKTSPNLDTSAIKQSLTQDGKEEITEAEIKRTLQKNNLLEKGEEFNLGKTEDKEEASLNPDKRLNEEDKKNEEKDGILIKNEALNKTEGSNPLDKEKDKKEGANQTIFDQTTSDKIKRYITSSWQTEEKKGKGFDLAA
ncbi:MAG: putative metalloprotease CJM1_0395 family protein [bacterium]